MSRAAASAMGLLALLVTGARPAQGDWVGERLCATGLPRNGEFGSAVAIAQNGKIAVGDYRHDVVYLFTRDANGCKQLDPIPGHAGEWFGFALAADGNQLLVGAPQSGGTGKACLYDLTQDTPKLLDTLTVSQAQRGDEVGSSVALHGNMKALGARRTAAGRGLVYFGSADSFEAVPVPDGLVPGAELGQSVALSGNTLVMGAPFPFRGSGSPGAAYALELPTEGSPGTPEPFSLSTSGLEREAAFGYSVAVVDNRILVGAPLADRNGVDAGAVFEFQREGTKWSEGTELRVPSHGGDQLGVALALDDSTKVIGARYADGTRGAAYLVGPSGGALKPQQTIPARAQFGFSVAVNGDIAVVGAFRENGTGAAYRFQLVPDVELDMDTEVQEAATTLSVGLRTSDGNPLPRDVTFRIHTLAGTAKERATEEDEGDYLRLDREVTLHAGERTTSVGLIALYPDDICEGNETFQVILSDLSGTPIQAVEVTIVDDDSSGGLELTPALLHTSEDGTTAVLSVRLTCPPTADVDISLSTSDPTEGIVSPDRLTFNSGNWDSPRKVQVTGQDDALCDGLQIYSVEVRTTSADPNYAGLSRSIPAENADDERACLSAAKTVCTDAGGTVIYTISLSNSGPQPPGEPARLVDRLPPEVSVVTASANLGTATADPVARSVQWSGPVPPGTDTVTITIVAALDGPPGPELGNRAGVTYVRDDRGNRETVPIVFGAGDVIPCP